MRLLPLPWLMQSGTMRNNTTETNFQEKNTEWSVLLMCFPQKYECEALLWNKRRAIVKGKYFSGFGSQNILIIYKNSGYKSHIKL